MMRMDINLAMVSMVKFPEALNKSQTLQASTCYIPSNATTDSSTDNNESEVQYFQSFL